PAQDQILLVVPLREEAAEDASFGLFRLDELQSPGCPESLHSRSVRFSGKAVLDRSALAQLLAQLTEGVANQRAGALHQKVAQPKARCAGRIGELRLVDARELGGQIQRVVEIPQLVDEPQCLRLGAGVDAAV